MPKKRLNGDLVISKWNGVTLVEMLVVVGVIALLLSVTLPAVQSARNASRRTVCGNNLRQIGIAITSFHSRKNSLPIGQHVLSQIASDLEIPTVEDQFFGQQIQVAPPILRCPSEPSNPSFVCEVNYFMSVGSAISPLNGAASPDFETRGKLKKLSYSDFSDGLSNTAIFSEHLQLQISCIRCHPSTKWWRSSVRFGPGEEISMRYFLNQELKANNLTAIPNYMYYSNTWVNNDFFYDHLWGPNKPMVIALSIGRDSIQPPSSSHIGGVQVLFADGSVHFFSDNVSDILWAEIGSRSGGEANVVE